MALRNNTTSLPCSTVSSLFLVFTLLSLLSVSLFIALLARHSPQTLIPQPPTPSSINVLVADLAGSFNYGLLRQYWSLRGDSRLGTDEDREIRSTLVAQTLEFPPYPESPLIKQYSAEYWILGDLLTPEESRAGSFARRVFYPDEADVVLVPFFATISAEMQLGVGKGPFSKKAGNEDYRRQREVVDFVKGTEAWKRSGGRDHVFVLTDYDLVSGLSGHVKT